MRVLHVVSGSPFGGVQRVVAQLAAEQQRRGMDVRVLCLYSDPHMLDELRARHVPFATTGGTRPSLAGCLRFAAYLRRSNASIVHIHSSLLWSSVLGLLLRTLRLGPRASWITHVHTYQADMTDLKTRVVTAVSHRLTDAYICVSQSVVRSIHARVGSGKPTYTVYNGIEARDYMPHARTVPDVPVYGMATRFGPGKGLWEFLAVAEQIMRLQPNARFALAGEGPLWQDVKEFVRTRGWEEQFELPGHIDDVRSFLSGLDVALFTGPRDACPLGLMEPMLAGTPVVAYRTGAGSDELIRNNETGLQVPYNEPEALALACVNLTRNRELASRLTAAAHEDLLNRFSIDTMCTSVDDVYGEVTGERPATDQRPKASYEATPAARRGTT